MTKKDAMYHSKCLLALYRRLKQKSCVLDDNKNGFKKQVHDQVLAELTLYMEQTENEDKGYIFKLADLANLYKTRVRELGGHTPDRVHTTKLKQRLMLHIENLKEFQDSNSHCYLAFDDDVRTVLKIFYEKSYDDETFVLSEGAKIIRRDILLEDSTFDGNFTRDCQQHFLPQSLKSFVDNILQGSKISSSHKQLTQSTLTISQLIVQNSIKRIRKNLKTTNEIHHSRARESPLEVYLGMLMHATTRKKCLIEKLHNLGISISYKLVMKLATTLGNNLLTHYNTVKIVCSPTLKSNVFTTAALDNKDHNPSSTTAEGSFHGTGISLFQHPTMKNPGVERDIGKTNSLKRKLLQLPALYANVSPISDFKKEPKIPDYSTTEFSLLNNENQTDVEERLVV